jgi:thioredoxin 1
MDYHDKVIILNKYFNKYIEERRFNDMRNTLNSMKTMHGTIINTMIDVKDSKESNRLEVLSELQIISNKMSDIIIDSTNTYDKLMETENNNKNKAEAGDTNKPVHEDSPSLILFYADWCGPCKAFLPTWNKLEEGIKHNDLNIVKFSCVEHKEKCDKIAFITSFPTVVLYDPSKKSINKFTGNREINTILDFVNKELNMDVTM